MLMNFFSSRSARCAVAVVLCGGGLVGCKSSPAPTVPVAAVAAAPAPAPSRAEAKEPDATRFTTTGPLVAEQQSDVAAERDGRVVHIAAELGDHVRRGEVLASLDERAVRTAMDSEAAHLASLKAQVREWQSEEKMDEADLRRADDLRSAKIMSDESWEHVKYKLDEVNAEVARYKSDEAQVEADLAAAKLQLEQCHVVAPLTGVVGRRSLRLEQEVKKGDVLFWVTAEAPLRILFTVPESAMAAYSVGAPLELTTPDYPNLRQAARILRVSPVVDPASDSIQVIGAVEKPSKLLKPGMSMQVAIAAKGNGAP
jgi:RND family efflux transporter MFP subunit